MSSEKWLLPGIGCSSTLCPATSYILKQSHIFAGEKNHFTIIDRKTFEQLFVAHYAHLCNHAFRVTGDKGAAEDVVQDVFLKLWNKRAALKVEKSLESYLFRATTNSALNYLKTAQRMVHDAIALAQRPAETIDTDQERAQIALKAAIQSALSSLPPRCKTIFVLNRYEGMSYQQIADHLDISFHTVKNQMTIAISRLRVQLAPFLEKKAN